MKLRLTAIKKAGSHIHVRISARTGDQWATNGTVVFSAGEWRELMRGRPDIEVRDPLVGESQ